MDYEQGDIILCTVDRIIGTTVFVKLPGNKEGTIILSEISPGRIRNLRDYVVPKKKIVCKILKTFGENIHLSLRRVTQKEKKEVMEEYKQEKGYISVIKSILGEKSKEIVEEINKKERLYEFIEESKIDSKNLEKIVGKENSEKILLILKKQKQKKVIAKKEILLTTNEKNGLELIKKVLGKIENAEVKYISGGIYSLRKESNDIKKADNELKEIILEIEKFAKKNNMEFSIKEK